MKTSPQFFESNPIFYLCRYLSGWDYHTVGAGAAKGIRSADGKIKKTAATGLPETLLSRRQYLYDASFLVALQGSTDAITACTQALENPVWPIFLGRKCCIPSEPVFHDSDAYRPIGNFENLTRALESHPWQLRANETKVKAITLNTFIEHPAGSPEPENAKLSHDIPKRFGYFSHGARWIIPGTIEVNVEKYIPASHDSPKRRSVDYGSPQWKAARMSRLKLDSHLCVFCKAPATQVHHVSYDNVGKETDEDLRSICDLCHDACTMLEYSHSMESQRVDPSNKEQRQDILDQIERILAERKSGHRRELLADTRAFNFFEDSINATTESEV